MLTWDHATHAGHDCPVCGLTQYVQDPAPRPVTVGPRVFSLPSAAGGCANGRCETPQSFRPAPRFGR